MRHKWIHKKGFSECVKCGCSKQRYYGLLLYFVDGIKDPFLKAPKCANTQKAKPNQTPAEHPTK